MSLAELQKTAFEENKNSRQLGQLLSHMKVNSLAKQLSQSSLECHDINEEKESRITSRKGEESTIYKSHKRQHSSQRSYLQPRGSSRQTGLNEVTTPGADMHSY